MEALENFFFLRTFQVLADMKFVFGVRLFEAEVLAFVLLLMVYKAGIF